MTLWSALAAAALVTTAVACRADMAPQGRDTHKPQPPEHAYIDPLRPGPATNTPPAAVISETPIDRGIRRDLNVLLSDDPDLRDREIAVVVRNGDVSVTGTVRTEAERERINDLAMAIPDVKSVANAVRVSTREAGRAIER